MLALARTELPGTVVLITADCLPDELVGGAGIVARDLGLQPEWLNVTPALPVERLPAGLSERLYTKRFGERLVVHFIGRLDQICLKLHAAVDRTLDSRHVADLLALRPTGEEMIAAARWCLAQDAGEQFPMWLKSCLEQLGYANAAESIEDTI